MLLKLNNNGLVPSLCVGQLVCTWEGWGVWGWVGHGGGNQTVGVLLLSHADQHAMEPVTLRSGEEKADVVFQL